MTFAHWLLSGVGRNKYAEISSLDLVREAKRYAMLFGGNYQEYLAQVQNRRIVVPSAGGTWQLRKEMIV